MPVMFTQTRAMLRRVLKSFDAPKPKPLPEPDEKLALGALMVRVAMSDHNYEPAEISRIDRLLAERYGLKPIEAAKTRAICERLERQAPETGRFAEVIRQSVSHEARLDALEALWEIVLADGTVQEAELKVIEGACTALGLNEDDNLRARQIAETR